MAFAAFRTALNDFDTADYTRRVTAVGIQRVATDRRTVTQVTALAAAAAEHRSRWGCLYGERVATVVDLADAFLGSQAYLLTHERPRYEAYAAVPVLRQVLGVDRGTRPVDRARIWAVFREMLDALVDTERQALSGGTHRAQFDPDVARDRLQALGELRGRIPVEFRTPPDRAPAALASLERIAADRTGTRAVRQLVALPQTGFHDEISFLRLIQLAECLFHGALVYVRHALAGLWIGRVARAAALVRTAAEFATPLVTVFHAVRVMPPAHFLAFRPATGDASAVQSVSWQALDAHVYGLHPDKVPVLSSIPEVRPLLDLADPAFVPLTRAAEISDGLRTRRAGASADLTEAVDLLDRRLRAWTSFHERQLAARRDPGYLPPGEPGTGGTRGQPYLARTLRKRRPDTQP